MSEEVMMNNGAITHYQREEANGNSDSRTVAISMDKYGKTRTVEDVFNCKSSLKAPIMLLTGHSGELYACRFHPGGKNLVTAGHDKNILIWNTFGDCDNVAALKGHHGAVTDLCFTYDGGRMLTSSADKTVGFWDYETGAKIRTYRGHSNYVNACAFSGRGVQLACSASDDGSIKVWDSRSKQLATSLENKAANLACCFNSFGNRVISGGIDNDIKVWDLSSGQVEFVVQGHLDSVTSVKLSTDGAFLLSNSMDKSVRMWDIYPYCSGERCLKMFFGHVHNFEKNLLRCCFSPDNKLVASGSGDCSVYVWDGVTRALLFKLPGHEGSVNDIDFHPTEPIIASCSTDRRVYIGELNV